MIFANSLIFAHDPKQQLEGVVVALVIGVHLVGVERAECQFSITVFLIGKAIVLEDYHIITVFYIQLLHDLLDPALHPQAPLALTQCLLFSLGQQEEQFDVSFQEIHFQEAQVSHFLVGQIGTPVQTHHAHPSQHTPRRLAPLQQAPLHAALCKL